MKIKQMLRWNWQNSWLSLVIVYAVMVGLCLLSAILTAVMDEGDIYFNGLTVSSTVMVFVLGIVFFSQSLRFGLATGVSRRSVFWGFGAFILLFALITVAADFLLERLFGLLVAPSNELLTQIYDRYIQANSKPAAFISLAVCSLTLKLLAGLSGFFIGGAYYRMSKALKLLVSIGVPVTLFVILPLAVGMLPEKSQLALLAWLEAGLVFLGETPYYLALVVAVTGVLFFVFSWLFIRRAPAKPVN